MFSFKRYLDRLGGKKNPQNFSAPLPIHSCKILLKIQSSYQQFPKKGYSNTSVLAIPITILSKPLEDIV